MKCVICSKIDNCPLKGDMDFAVDSLAQKNETINSFSGGHFLIDVKCDQYEAVTAPTEV